MFLQGILQRSCKFKHACDAVIHALCDIDTRMSISPGTVLCVYTVHLLCSLHIQWRHNECDDVSNNQCLDCLLSRLFRRRSKKTSKFRVIGLYERNSPGGDEFPAERPVTRKMFPFDDVIMFIREGTNIFVKFNYITLLTRLWLLTTSAWNQTFNA